LSWGDQLHLQALHSAGTRYGRLSYSLPLTYEGTRLSAIASALNYEVLQGDFTALSPTGQSQSVGFELRQALWRRAQYRIDVTGSVEQKRFEQSVQGLDTTERRLTSRQLSLESQLTDQWLKGPQLSAEAIALNTLQLSAVQTDIHTIANSVQTTRLWRWSLSRSQPLWSAAAQAVDTRLLLHASGQRSAHSLDSAEKFYVGGSSGVRAFPASEGFASNGHMLNAELRMQFSPSFSVGFMRDRASVWEHEQTHYRYQGYGIQWSWRITPQTQMRFVFARRDKANPLPNPITGTDRDGSLERDRMWLSINGVLR
jgi:hemolysin activation/secretion protein